MDVPRHKSRNLPRYAFILFFAVIIIVLLIVSESLIDFIHRHFITPLGRYYTPVNSVVYGLVLFVAIFWIAQVLTQLKVNVTSRFIFSVMPYLFIGSAARALNDSGIFNTALLVSPPIYFVVFGYTFLCLLVSLRVAPLLNHRFHLLFSTLGFLPAVYLSLLIVFKVGVTNIRGGALILAFTGGSSLLALPLLYLVNRFIHFESLPVSGLVTVAHLLDASATHVAVSYFGYFEQHPLPNFLTNLFGTTFVLIPTKFLAILILMIVVDKFINSEEQRSLRGMIKITILTLGFATGTRDLLRLMMRT